MVHAPQFHHVDQHWAPPPNAVGNQTMNIFYIVRGSKLYMAVKLLGACHRVKHFSI